MAHYIDKDALVAKIEKCYNECLKKAKITDSDYWNAKADAYRNVLVILNDTLEVKEINTEGAVKLLFENNDRIYDEYGNYYYKNSENDYRFYHKIDEDNWDEDRLSLSEVTERLFSVSSIKVKEVDLDYIKKELGQLIRFNKPDGDFGWGTLYNVATHFFELGLKAQKGE